MKLAGQQFVSKSVKAFCISNPPEMALKVSASYVHEDAQDAGGTKTVVNAADRVV